MRTFAVLAGIAAMSVPAVSATAEDEPRRPSACQRMKARNVDRSPHRRVVVAERGSEEVGGIAACILPRGRVRRLVSWDDGLARDRYHVNKARGYHVLIVNSYSDQYGGRSESLRLHDVRTGTGAMLTSRGCNVYYDPCNTGSRFGKVVLGTNGAGALETTALDTGASTLQAFAPDGALTRLDDAPVDTLRVGGGEIVWTRDGVERRAPLPR